MGTARYKRLLSLHPSSLQIIRLILKPFFAIVPLYFIVAIVCYNQQMNLSTEKDLLAMEQGFRQFLRQQKEVMDYIGRVILNRGIEADPKKLSSFLNDAQAFLGLLGESFASNRASLLWMTADSKFYSSLGRPDFRIFGINETFIQNCRQHPGKIFLSNKYANPALPGIEHIDIGLSFVNDEGRERSVLIAQFNARDLLSLMANNGNYDVLIVNKDSDIILENNSIKIPKNTLNEIISTASSLEKVDSFGHNFGRSIYCLAVQNTPYLLFLEKKTPFYKEREFFYSTVKRIPIIFLLFFFSAFMVVWLERIYGNLSFRMLTILKRFSGKSIKSDGDKTVPSVSFLSYFKDFMVFFKNLREELRSVEKLMDQKHIKLQNALRTLSKREKALTENKKTIHSMKHYHLENEKFRKRVSGYLRARMLDIITKSEILVQDRSAEISLSHTKREELMGEININLKKIFNFAIGSQKMLTDPMEAISEALTSIMIYAVLRNVKIKTHIIKTFDNIWIDRLKLQLIIIGIIVQSIETSPSESEIVITVEKILLNDEHYLNIIIEDSSYGLYQESAHHACFEFEHISLENIRSLIEEEKGLFDLEHQLNQGRRISISFPYYFPEENEREESSNVYQLF